MLFSLEYRTMDKVQELSNLEKNLSYVTSGAEKESVNKLL
jgi:hypothetical protein